jgi:hypothetical protein
MARLALGGGIRFGDDLIGGEAVRVDLEAMSHGSVLACVGSR